MSTFFLNRGLTSSVVNRALNRVRPISRTSALNPSPPSCNSDRVPLVLMYHPTCIHIHKIIRGHFHHLQRDATNRHIFPYPPLSAFCKNHSLRDTLVHTSFTPNAHPHSPTAPSLQSVKVQNLPIYLLPHQYPRAQAYLPGEATLHLNFPESSPMHSLLTMWPPLHWGSEAETGDHFTEHLQSTRKKGPEPTVACHSNAPPCSLANISACGVLQCSCEAQHKLEEQHLIFRLGTLQPSRFNI
eukprot:g18024.t1